MTLVSPEGSWESYLDYTSCSREHFGGCNVIEDAGLHIHKQKVSELILLDIVNNAP